MRTATTQPKSALPGGHLVQGSVLIIVLWIAIGLISVTLYFADSMTMELRAADNRASGVAAEQALEGAARYVGWALASFATNGAMPTNTLFTCENIQIGDARAWIIGRDSTLTTATAGTAASEPVFGLVDEASKLNLNRVSTNTLEYLPNVSTDIAEAIIDWRSTNASALSFNYGAQGYDAKHGSFESVDELRLIYGMTIDVLAGDDINRNGVIDGTEKSLTGGTTVNPGLLEYTTVFSREPNFHSDGSSLTNVNTQTDLQALLNSTFGSGRANTILTAVGYNTGGTGGGGRAGGGGGGSTTVSLASVLQFYIESGLSASDFEKIADDLTSTASTNQYIYGRVNINTASEPVLIALFMGLNIDEQTATTAADTLITYRTQNADNIGSIDWLVTALGQSSPVVMSLATRDLVTTHAFQFSADIAAVGPLGRGYRRSRFVFDITDGTPKIIYREDLSRLGWALGAKVRENLVAQNTP
jgi:DNA uptake protein ComE-like DNA-binding protein